MKAIGVVMAAARAAGGLLIWSGFMSQNDVKQAKRAGRHQHRQMMRGGRS
ncbi:MAG: hypothetical protein HY020_08270 [Burkholderiales bacterium]|nr:hypothetical protein [Burkholderiales bacterium]